MIKQNYIERSIVIGDIILDWNKCSNTSCEGKLIQNRDIENVSKDEKKYGLLCSICKDTLKDNIRGQDGLYKVVKVECIKCGKLVQILALEIHQDQDTLYCEGCSECSSNSNINKLFTNKQLIGKD